MSNQSMSFKGLRLLVVDNDFDTRTLLTYLFELGGAEIMTATSVAEAIAIMSFFKPDILISDIYLPNEDGYSLILKVKNLETKRGRKIPAIALTAYPYEEYRYIARMLGYDLYLLKPIDLDELAFIVASLTGIDNTPEILGCKNAEASKQENFN
ncbi:response regulator [Nostoc sp.]|uniref:response regulator n=1 Tax=Nostoc sp. TaxID=1180 RepID=UPI002FF6E8A2